MDYFRCEMNTLALEPIRTSCWIHDLVRRTPEARLWKLSKFRIPGTHNSATFGSGTGWTKMFKSSWKCQDRDLYDQLMCGIRYLDIRLALEDDGLWWPCHGIARKTGDALAFRGGFEEKDDTLLGQIVNFVKKQPGELVILDISTTTNANIDALWSIFMAALEDRMLPAPGPQGIMPTWNDMMSSTRNVLIVSHKKEEFMPCKEPSLLQKWTDLVWPSSESSIQDDDTKFWLSVPYTDETWQAGQPSISRIVTEQFMQYHDTITASRNCFWVAPCQLTPSFGGQYWCRSPSFSPRRLATTANSFTRAQLTTSSLWKQRASILVVDFPDDNLIIDIVRMNM